MDSDNDSEFYSPVPDRRKPNQVFKKNSNELKFVAYQKKLNLISRAETRIARAE